MAGDVQYLALKKLTGSPTIIGRAAKHNLREIQKELGADSHINSLRTHKNIVLAGADTSAGVAAMYRDTLHACEISKLRKNAVLAVECVVSLPVNSTIDPVAYFGDALQWLRDYFKCPVISAVVHLDESAPHCHILILPLLNGRMNGSDLVGNRTKLIQMQKDFNTAVASRYGLKQNSGAKMSKQLRTSAANLVIATIEREPELLERPNIKLALFEAIAANPVAMLDALGLELPTSAPKSLVAIMTKPAPEKRIH